MHDVYIRCQLARDQQQPDTLQMLGAIESRLLVKFHVVGSGQVGERWHWSINMEISQLNGAQQKLANGPVRDKFLEGGFCSKI